MGEVRDQEARGQELLTPMQLAERLQLGIGTIYYWVHLRAIPFIRVGKHLRFDLKAVLRHFTEVTKARIEAASGAASRPLRKVVTEASNRSLTTRDPDHAAFRRKE